MNEEQKEFILVSMHWNIAPYLSYSAKELKEDYPYINDLILSYNMLVGVWGLYEPIKL